jgi:hypothetical protein
MSKYDLLFEDIQKRLPSPGNSEVGLDAQEKAKRLEHMNSELTPLTNTPTVNPYSLVQRIKDRVGLAFGLTFNDAYLLGDSGTKELFLKPIQNITVHNFSGEYTTDNGYLKVFPGGLQIKFQYVKTGKVYHIHAEIVEVPLPSPVPVSEKKD